METAISCIKQWISAGKSGTITPNNAVLVGGVRILAGDKSLVTRCFMHAGLEKLLFSLAQ